MLYKLATVNALAFALSMQMTNAMPTPNTTITDRLATTTLLASSNHSTVALLKTDGADGDIIESGQCGAKSKGGTGKRCSATGGHPCCSSNNWCGSTVDHCEKDIQEDYSFARWEEPGANLLSRTPMLMTHDSGTAYFPNEWKYENFLKLHYVSTVDQLNCGARVLDARLRYNDESQQNHYHHGSIGDPVNEATDKTIESDLPDLISWAKEHPNDLAILYVSHCERPSSCTDEKHMKPFNDKNMLILRPEDETWHAMSAQSILAMSKAKSGHGLIVLLKGAVDEMWESDMCYKYFTTEDKNEDRIESYRSRMFSNVRQSITGKYDLPLWKLWSIQNFYQQGSPLDSCTPEIQQDHNAHLTKLTVEQAKRGEFVGEKALNLLEINHICMYGLDLAEQISKQPGSMTTITANDRGKCIAACGGRFREDEGRCSCTRDLLGRTHLNWDECTDGYKPSLPGLGVGPCNCECVKK